MSNSYMVYASSADDVTHLDTVCENTLGAAAKEFERRYNAGRHSVDNSDIPSEVRNFALICFETGEAKFYKAICKVEPM